MDVFLFYLLIAFLCYLSVLEWKNKGEPTTHKAQAVLSLCGFEVHIKDPDVRFRTDTGLISLPCFSPSAFVLLFNVLVVLITEEA